MKSKLMTGLIATLIAGGAFAQTAAPAQPASAPAAAAKPAPADRAARMQQHFAKVDKNGDGAIDRKEAEGHRFLSKDFDAIDANKDGKLSKEELQTRHTAMHDQRKAKFEERFKQADADGNGVLSKAEAEKMPGLAKHFDKLDADKNGQLTREEMLSGHQRGHGHHGKRMGEKLKAADKDGDGAITKAEAASLPRLEKNFDKVDGNKDGKVTREEMHAAMREHREHRRDMKDMKDTKDSKQ